MKTWLKEALDYIPRWLDFQMRQSEQPGCVIAVAYKGGQGLFGDHFRKDAVGFGILKGGAK